MQRILYFAAVVVSTTALSAQNAEPWRTQYHGDDATGGHVIGLWQFLPGKELEDSSDNGHSLTLRGGSVNSDGLFAGALRSDRGWPVEDKQHAAVAKDHPNLSPSGPFTIEMWIKPRAELDDCPHAFLIDKKYVAHDDYQFTLAAPDSDGKRQMQVSLGFGEGSEQFWSPRAIRFKPDTWYHLAFTYDAGGTVTFWVNAANQGSDSRPGRGSVHAGRHDLFLGDRVGSNYSGFPGLIDQVRITSGVREFRPIAVTPLGQRTAFLRMEPSRVLKLRVTNLTRETLNGVQLSTSIHSEESRGSHHSSRGFPSVGDPASAATSAIELAGGKFIDIEHQLDTSLRPGDYLLRVVVSVRNGSDTYRNVDALPVRIVARTVPNAMPVIMWGGPGINGIETLKRIGFTHCFALSADYSRIWDAGKPVQAVNDQRLRDDRRFLDAALAADVRVICQLAPGHWLDKRGDLLQIDRSGKPYARQKTSASTTGLREFCFNVGASAGETWGEHPAFAGALINTEIRGGTQVSFHPHEREAFRKHSGYDIPDDIPDSQWASLGVNHSKLKDFPADRIIPDDFPPYVYYKWFWKQGDGWNDLHTAVHDGLMSISINRQNKLWTFYDPAVRVPSLWGSGGNVDVISQWTYSYPDPIRIGLSTDELLAMAEGAQRPQDVMKMTQVIWYRSQTAPLKKADNEAVGKQNVTEDFDPTAQYITIAPMHLREAFWSKISRPIKGIMYHGWQSLVPTESSSAYRYTHSETQHELGRLVHDVIQPLGPMLTQIPAAKTDVAFLESFASQMFAGRGTYGWGHRWTGDAWHVLQYAQLQPKIVYEETLLRDGLDDYKVLIMPSCDVLPASVAEKIKVFQQRGGIIVADQRLAPGIKADILLPVYTRTKKADVDKQAFQKLAADLRVQLDPKYRRLVDSSNPDIVTHRRRFGTTDYVFVVNDHREPGHYVGQHGMVMENGLPADATVTLNRHDGYVYDLLDRRKLSGRQSREKSTTIPVSLGPASGGIYMVTARSIEQVKVETPDTTQRGKSIEVNVMVTDGEKTPIDAVVPLRIDVFDPNGRPAEFSGHHAAVGGRLALQIDMAPNDEPGMWQVRVQELASGITSSGYFRLQP